MTGISSINSALNGIHAGTERVQRAAAQIAGAGSAAGDLATPLVELKVGEFQVKASVQVIKAADQMLGSLIDITA